MRRSPAEIMQGQHSASGNQPPHQAAHPATGVAIHPAILAARDRANQAQTARQPSSQVQQIAADVQQVLGKTEEWQFLTELAGTAADEADNDDDAGSDNRSRRGATRSERW
jgi:hypothetical protein